MTRRFLLMMAVCPLLIGSQPSHAAPRNKPKTAEAVRAVDDAWAHAEISGNAAFVDALLLPDYRSVGSDGKITGKKAIVDRVRGRHSPESVTTAAQEVAAWKAIHPTPRHRGRRGKHGNPDLDSDQTQFARTRRIQRRLHLSRWALAGDLLPAHRRRTLTVRAVLMPAFDKRALRRRFFLPVTSRNCTEPTGSATEWFRMESDQLSLTFAALADPTRRAILHQLLRGEAAVGELAEPFHISTRAISKHVAVLEAAGLVTRVRDRQRRPSRIRLEPLTEVDRC